MENLREDRKKLYGKIWIHFAIFLLLLSAVANIIISIPYAPVFLQRFGRYYENLSHHNIQIYALLHRLIGFMLLLISYRLYKRMEAAWIMVIATLAISITLKATRFHEYMSPMVAIELLIFIILIYHRKEFRRKSDPISVKKSLLIASGSVILMILVSSLGFLALNDEYHELKTLGDAILQSVKILFLMDVSSASISKVGERYLDLTILFNWIFVMGALFYVLKPVVYDPMIRNKDRKQVAKLVSQYGENPMSYLAMEEDKKYFFGSSVQGVIAFAVVNDVAVVCGDIICSEADGGELLSEFMGFCTENHYSIMLLNITERFMNLYKLMGFGMTKYGEDACFLLSDYNLSGGKVAKVRAAINHANKDGITISEYKPLIQRDKEIEREIQEVSKEWLTAKKSGELSFMLGGIGLENPMDRRFFLARDTAGKMQGFVVFVPYDNKKAYLADVTRRRTDAPQGVMEKLIIEGFNVLKEEGVVWGSMGLVPLANVREEEEKARLTTKLFEYVYENLNELYGFKALHHAKEKYAPTHWQSRYIAYYPRIFTMQMAYAIVKVQNPGGILDYVRAFVKEKFMKKRANP